MNFKPNTNTNVFKRIAKINNVVSLNFKKWIQTTRER